MRRSWLFWFAVGSFVGILVSLLVVGGLFWAWQRSDRLASGVIVDGVPIGNLPIPLAASACKAH
jgi:hypothetical protein